MIRRLLAFCCAMLLLLCAAQAENTYYARVDDEADLLTEREETALRDAMEPLTEYGDVVFWSTYKRGTADTLAERYFDQKISAQSDHPGVIFLIDMQSRTICIFVRGTFEKRVGRSGAYAITDNVYTYASKRDYLTCAAEAFSQVQALMEGQRIFSPMRVICNLLLALSLGLIAAYLTVRRASLHSAGTQQSDTMNAKADIEMQVTNKHLIKSTKRRIESSSGGGSRGGFSGGGGGGFSGGGGSSGSHGF